MYSIYIMHVVIFKKKLRKHAYSACVVLYIIYIITIYSHHLLSFAVKYNGHLDLNKAVTCKTYSSLLAHLSPAQRELLL